MLKTKILKVLPLWLIGLIVVTACQAAGTFIPVKDVNQTPILNTASAAGEPQVLGAATSIRGEATTTTADEKIVHISDSDLSAISAKSYLVFDLASGQDLLEKNINQKLSIASLTKLVTALVAYQNIDLSQNITITKSDILNVSPDLNFLAGDSVKAGDVFNAMLIGSCNDAALTLADYVAGQTQKNFIGLMNQEAQTLGMDDSSFANPMGFDDPNNYSTAQDIKILITETQQLAVFKNLGRMTGYKFTGSSGQTYSTVATNTLIKNYPDLQAIKTGYTDEARGAMATKLSVNGREIVILVLDSQNRESDTLEIRSALLDDFKWN